MKQTSLLKRLRVILAILFFVPIILYFVDFANLLPDSLHGLLHLQIVPAILAGILWIIIAQLLLVLVFGRLYCSVICPAVVIHPDNQVDDISSFPDPVVVPPVKDF